MENGKEKEEEQEEGQGWEQWKEMEQKKEQKQNMTRIHGFNLACLEQVEENISPKVELMDKSKLELFNISMTWCSRDKHLFFACF